MTKESSCKKQWKASENSPVVEQKKKSCVKPKKMGSEIDEIFARKKGKIPGKEMKAKMKKPAKASTSNAKLHDKMRIAKIKDLRQNPFAEPVSQLRKKTGDGLPIYTEEELGFGKSDAGGTHLCPFDCKCCF